MALLPRLGIDHDAEAANGLALRGRNKNGDPKAAIF